MNEIQCINNITNYGMPYDGRQSVVMHVWRLDGVRIYMDTKCKPADLRLIAAQREIGCVDEGGCYCVIPSQARRTELRTSDMCQSWN